MQCPSCDKSREMEITSQKLGWFTQYACEYELSIYNLKLGHPLQKMLNII